MKFDIINIYVTTILSISFIAAPLVHGKPKESKHNGVEIAISAITVLLTLYKLGFYH